jgi:predicted CoA-binding protein
MTGLQIVGEPAPGDGHGSGYACVLPATQGEYTDEELLAIYGSIRTIAMVGASPDWVRPSYFAMKYLQRKGYRVIPVNPKAAGTEILGERAYASLSEIPVPVDVVDVFRRPDAVPGIVDEAIAIGAKVVWLQLGVRSNEGRRAAEAAGLKFIQDRCMKIEYGRLSGELAWSGVNSGIISSRRRKRL